MKACLETLDPEMAMSAGKGGSRKWIGTFGEVVRLYNKKRSKIRLDLVKRFGVEGNTIPYTLLPSILNLLSKLL